MDRVTGSGTSSGHERAHDQEHNDETELFPRVLTTRLVGDQEAARDKRLSLQALVIGAGLAILALGLPLQSRLQVPSWSAPLPRALVGSLAESLGLTWERAGFLLAAVFLGLSVPAITATLKRVGFDHAVALPSTLIALLSPLGWLGSTTACDLSLGVLLTSWLMHELFAERSVRRVVVVYAVGISLHVDVVLLLPAAALSMLGAPSGGGETAGRAKSAWTVAAAGLAIVLLAGARGLLPGGSLWPLHFQVDGLFVPVMLGLALWGLVAPWLRASREVARPPAWCVAFLLVPLPTLVTRGGAQGAWLIPVAALGLADFIQRGRTEHATVARGLALLGLQLAATAALTFGWESMDPNRAWRATARAELEPSDLVLTDDPLHTFYLAQRWGLEVAWSGDPDLNERLDGAREAGRRVVLDTAGTADPAPAAIGSVYRLSPEGLEAPEERPERRQ